MPWMIRTRVDGVVALRADQELTTAFVVLRSERQTPSTVDMS
jgi:hypothetical protein